MNTNPLKTAVFAKLKENEAYKKMESKKHLTRRRAHFPCLARALLPLIILSATFSVVCGGSEWPLRRNIFRVIASDKPTHSSVLGATSLNPDTLSSQPRAWPNLEGFSSSPQQSVDDSPVKSIRVRKWLKQYQGLLNRWAPHQLSQSRSSQHEQQDDNLVLRETEKKKKEKPTMRKHLSPPPPRAPSSQTGAVAPNPINSLLVKPIGDRPFRPAEVDSVGAQHVAEVEEEAASKENGDNKSKSAAKPNSDKQASFSSIFEKETKKDGDVEPRMENLVEKEKSSSFLPLGTLKEDEDEDDNADVGTGKKQDAPPRSITSSATKFLSSLLGSFLPVFDSDEETNKEKDSPHQEGSSYPDARFGNSVQSQELADLHQRQMILKAQRHEQQRHGAAVAATNRQRNQIQGPKRRPLRQKQFGPQLVPKTQQQQFRPQPPGGTISRPLQMKKKNQRTPQRPQSFSSLSTPPQFTVSTIHHGGSNLAVRTGYAQVNRQQQQQQEQELSNENSANGGQPSKAAAAAAPLDSFSTPVPSPPVSAAATSTATNSTYTMETDKKGELTSGSSTTSNEYDLVDYILDQAYSDFGSSEQDYEIQSIRKIESENVVMDSKPLTSAAPHLTAEGSSGKKKKRPKQNLERFCELAIAATAKRLDREGKGSISKENLYKHLWNLVEFHGIPVTPSTDTTESNRQMVLLLDAVCGSGKKQQGSSSSSGSIPVTSTTKAPLTTNVRVQRSSPPTPATSFFEIDHQKQQQQQLETAYMQSNVLRSQSFVQQRKPNLQSSSEPEIITIKPHNPLAMAKFSEQELRGQTRFNLQPPRTGASGNNNNNNAFVVSGGFSFGGGGERKKAGRRQDSAGMKPGSVMDITPAESNLVYKKQGKPFLSPNFFGDDPTLPRRRSATINPNNPSFFSNRGSSPPKFFPKPLSTQLPATSTADRPFGFQPPRPPFLPPQDLRRGGGQPKSHHQSIKLNQQSSNSLKKQPKYILEQQLPSLVAQQQRQQPQLSSQQPNFSNSFLNPSRGRQPTRPHALVPPTRPSFPKGLTQSFINPTSRNWQEPQNQRNSDSVADMSYYPQHPPHSRFPPNPTPPSVFPTSPLTLHQLAKGHEEPGGIHRQQHNPLQSNELIRGGVDRGVRQTPFVPKLNPAGFTTAEPWRNYTRFDRLDAVSIALGEGGGVSTSPMPPTLRRQQSGVFEEANSDGFSGANPSSAAAGVVTHGRRGSVDDIETGEGKEENNGKRQRNITQDDLHFVYNVTFYSPTPTPESVFPTKIVTLSSSDSLETESRSQEDETSYDYLYGISPNFYTEVANDEGDEYYYEEEYYVDDEAAVAVNEAINEIPGFSSKSTVPPPSHPGFRFTQPGREALGDEEVEEVFIITTTETPSLTDSATKLYYPIESSEEGVASTEEEDDDDYYDVIDIPNLHSGHRNNNNKHHHQPHAQKNLRNHQGIFTPPLKNHKLSSSVVKSAPPPPKVTEFHSPPDDRRTYGTKTPITYGSSSSGGDSLAGDRRQNFIQQQQNERAAKEKEEKEKKIRATRIKNNEKENRKTAATTTEKQKKLENSSRVLFTSPPPHLNSATTTSGPAIVPIRTTTRKAIVGRKKNPHHNHRAAVKTESQRQKKNTQNRNRFENRNHGGSREILLPSMKGIGGAEIGGSISSREEKYSQRNNYYDDYEIKDIKIPANLFDPSTLRRLNLTTTQVTTQRPVRTSRRTTPTTTTTATSTTTTTTTTSATTRPTTAATTPEPITTFTFFPVNSESHEEIQSPSKDEYTEEHYEYMYGDHDYSDENEEEEAPIGENLVNNPDSVSKPSNYEIPASTGSSSSSSTHALSSSSPFQSQNSFERDHGFTDDYKTTENSNGDYYYEEEEESVEQYLDDNAVNQIMDFHEDIYLHKAGGGLNLDPHHQQQQHHHHQQHQHQMEDNEIFQKSNERPDGSFRSSLRNDRFAENGLPNKEISANPALIDLEKSSDDSMNPEKLAYILIGVCCGLSILCLIIVAVSIGYKSETHYRLDDGRRKRHIKLIKASSSEESSSNTSASSSTSQYSETDQESGSDVDMSGMKLGPWFNGKHNMTLDRKSNMVFPTSVYLENLEEETADNKKPSALRGGDDLDEDGDDDQTGSHSTEDGGSLSSFDTLRTDPNLLKDPDPKPAARSPLALPLVHKSSTKSSRKSSDRGSPLGLIGGGGSSEGGGFKKKQKPGGSTSYSIISSSRFSSNQGNLNLGGSKITSFDAAGTAGVVQAVAGKSLGLTGSKSGKKRNSSASSKQQPAAATESFRFLGEEDESECGSTLAAATAAAAGERWRGGGDRSPATATPAGGGTPPKSGSEEEKNINKECAEIQWSSNTDRLI